MKLLLSTWMQELDAETIEGVGIPSIVLMENASQGAARVFARMFPPSDGYKHVIVLVGKGNNGGDGIAVGRILHQKGYNVEFVLFSPPEKLNPDPKINFHIIHELDLPYSVLTDVDALETIFRDFEEYPKAETIVIDALFGTGLNKPVRAGSLFSLAIEWVNGSGFKVAAIDIPSGLSDAFLPKEGPHVTADVTATFQCLKTAHLHPDGNRFCGHIEIIDIGIPWERVHRDAYYIDITMPRDFKHLLAARRPDAHKGHFGHGLTLAGSVDKPGAGILSSFAVLKTGAGLCTAAVQHENRLAPVLAHPELMTLVYGQLKELTGRLGEFDGILTGPGMGDNPATLEAVTFLLEHVNVPLVMDADALNVLAGKTELLSRSRQYPVVLTPHPGEFSRLTGISVGDILRDRTGISREFALKHNVYLILKGHRTLIATPGGRVYVNPTGNPGMATAGSGDVLGGMLLGMLCQFGECHPLEEVLQAAVFIHGYAGDLAVLETGEMGLTAADITAFIPDALQAIEAGEYEIPFGFS